MLKPDQRFQEVQGGVVRKMREDEPKLAMLESAMLILIALSILRVV